MTISTEGPRAVTKAIKLLSCLNFDTSQTFYFEEYLIRSILCTVWTHSQLQILFSMTRQTAVVSMEAFPELEKEILLIISNFLAN